MTVSRTLLAILIYSNVITFGIILGSLCDYFDSVYPLIMAIPFSILNGYGLTATAEQLRDKWFPKGVAMSLRSIKLSNIENSIMYFENQIDVLDRLKKEGVNTIDEGIEKYQQFIKELKEEREEVKAESNV